MAPDTQFVLLTQAISHDELATMDRPNMRRLIVAGSLERGSLRMRAQGVVTKVLPYFPVRLRRVVGRLASRVLTNFKRSASGSLLRDMEVDLLFCPFTAPTYFEPGLPTVCTIHDLQYKTYPEFFTPEDVSHRDRVFIDVCNKATAIIAVSDYSRSSAMGHGEIKSDRIRTILHRMAKRSSTDLKENKEVVRRYGLLPGKYLIYPANFWRHKNHEMLLTAFGIACHEGLPADIKLLCTGAPGARQACLKNAACEMGLEGRVVFPGYLPSNDLVTLMENSNGMIFPSLYEGFGLPVIEAMAAGVPVACSNTASLPEVVGDAAILFDPKLPVQIAQSIVSLVKNEALRARLVRAGQQRVDEFADSSRMAREYWDVFLYAMGNQKHVDLLTGVYEDGWASSQISISVAPARIKQFLVLELFLPEFTPCEKMRVRIAKEFCRSVDDSIYFSRGKSTTLTLDFPADGGRVAISISPSFIPSHYGFGEDGRLLSVMVRRCTIERDESERVSLYGA